MLSIIVKNVNSLRISLFICIALHLWLRFLLRLCRDCICEKLKLHLCGYAAKQDRKKTHLDTTLFICIMITFLTKDRCLN